MTTVFATLTAIPGPEGGRRGCRRHRTGEISYSVISTPSAVVLVALIAIITPICSLPAASQSVTRRATDIASLVAYPGFYQGQAIVLQADLIETGSTIVLVQEDELRALRVTSSGPITPRGRVEARGVFWDVGRLKPDDPRVAANNLQTVADASAETEWPKPGEVFVLRVTDVFPANSVSTPSLRDVVLDVGKYVDKPVTLTGQFRGRNLYGDLPQAPGLSRWDFVLKSADAALWVTGTQPRGKGFDLNVSARIDTGRWLEASGVVKHGRGLIWLESVKIVAAQAPAAVPALETVQEAGPPPVVVFSSPTEGEGDVPLDTRVRIQFSRDMDPASFKDQIRVGYAPSAAPAQNEPPAPTVTISYDAPSRGLSIRFAEPLTRFRTVKIELLGGIKARDGAAMAPWTLTFSGGG
jgi:Bacterial Ig-like domain